MFRSILNPSAIHYFVYKLIGVIPISMRIAYSVGMLLLYVALFFMDYVESAGVEENCQLENFCVIHNL